MSACSGSTATADDAGPGPSPSAAASSASAPERSWKKAEHRIPTDGGLSLWVTSIRSRPPSRGAVLLTHGAGSPASAVWDLPHGHSTLEALAAAGFDAFTVDVRGFGGSSVPAEMRGEKAGSPAVRARDVMPDVAAALRFAANRSGHPRVHLVGWSWGSLVAGMFASQYPERVHGLVLFAPVYDRKWPSRHRTQGVWRTEHRDLHMEGIDPAQEDPRVRRAYVERLFRFVAGENLRLPNGPYQDLYGPDAPIWDPSRVRSETLVLRGTEDPASLHEHAHRLFQALQSAPRRVYLELSGMGHFAFRTHRSRELQDAIVWFLRSVEGGPPAKVDRRPEGLTGKP